jgi:plastocyanin
MKKDFPLTLAGFIAFLVFSASIKSYAVTQVVNVQNFSFSPSSFTINAGDTAQWVRINGIHITTSVTVPGGTATWDIDLNSNTTSFIYVPAVAGSYTYKCVPHETMNMTGSFTVTCPSPTVAVTAGGPTTFCKPSSATLSASAMFESYQGNRNNSPLPGSTTSTLVVKSSVPVI